MSTPKTLAIIGAGPVGLAAAAHVLERGMRPVVLEAGPEAGHAVRQWQHVQLFSPWQYTVDRAAPLIDPNEHSCGTVGPHGARELVQDDPGFYLAGMKSYGRAPTFLMITGYEQVRSIAANIAGDREAAERVELKLSETGVCTRGGVEGGASFSCCGGPAPAGIEACCADDASAKAAGKTGCGCS